LEGRLFFDRGTSQYGTAGNGIQDDPDSEPGQANITVAFVDPTSGEVAATATTDSSGDFKAYLPKGNFLMYQFSDEFPYMCQSVKEVSRGGYNIAIGENNPKLSIGLLQGFLSFPETGIDLSYGGYYDRDPRVGHTLAWNGVTGVGTGMAGDAWDNDSGTHFLAEYGDIIPSFAPGFVTGVYPNTPDNLLVISVVPTLYNTLSYPHFDVVLAHSSEILVQEGDRVSRYQPIAKAGNRGYTYPNVVVHLGLVSGNEILDPYKPVFSMDYYSNLIEPFTYGCWGGSCPGGAVDCLRVPWLSLPVSQNENWQNYWIVEDQTHF
jgi:hypothetical protein